MYTNNNVNEIVSLNHNNNVNDNGFSKSKEAEKIAYTLVDKLGSQKSFPFYCKVAYNLPERKIWNNLETAMKGKNPGGLFNWLCRRDLNVKG